MEGLEVCSFVKCKLGSGNLLVGLRDKDVKRINNHKNFKGHCWKVKVGDKVCALHYTPCPGQQLKHAMKTGHVELEAEVGLVEKQYKHNKEQRLARKKKNLQLENELLRLEKEKARVASILDLHLATMKENCRYMHCF